jgi:uncharacterized protein (TIGR02001 family)
MRLFMSLARNFESKQQALAGAVRPARGRRAVIAAAAAAVSVLSPAAAQTSVNASVTSEYSARGMSLSKGRAAPQLRVDYDAAGGWYAGALLSRAALAHSETNMQTIVYGGYARTLASGLTWEAGALRTAFVNDHEYNYHEVYAGLAHERVAGRVYFSPSYYGYGKTLYTEVNASRPLRDRLTLIGHLGWLHPIDSHGERRRERLDLRVGLGYEVASWNFQLAVLASVPDRHGPDAPRALAVSASYGF